MAGRYKKPQAGAIGSGGKRANFDISGLMSGGANPDLTPAATNYLGGGYTGDAPISVDAKGLAQGGDVNTPVNLTPAQTAMYSKPFNPMSDNMYQSPSGFQRLMNPRAAAMTDQANFSAKQGFAMQNATDQVNDAKALEDVKAVNAHNSPFDDPDEADYAARLIVKQVGAGNINKLGAQSAIDQYLQGQSTLANSRAQTPGIEATSRELQNRADIGSATKEGEIQSKLADSDYNVANKTAMGTVIPSRTEADINENTLRGVKAQSGIVLNPAQTSLEAAKIDASQKELPSAISRSIYNNTNVPMGGESAAPYTLQLNPSGTGGILNPTPGAINRADPMGIMPKANIPSGTVFANGRAFAPKTLTAPAPNQVVDPATTQLGPPPPPAYQNPYSPGQLIDTSKDWWLKHLQDIRDSSSGDAVPQF